MITDEATQLAIKAECHADFYFYTRYMFKVRRNFKWIDNWHHKVICDALMKVYRGDCKRLIINIPPRYSKTEIVVVNFISWCLGMVSDCEFIYTSYSAELASNYASQAKDLLDHENYKQIFDTRLKQDSKAKGHWKTTDNGVVYSAGAGGTITGFGAGKMRDGFGGAIVIDDPHKADEGRSEKMRQNVIDWFTNTIESRTNSPDTPIIIIMQRLHEGDLSGFLLDGGNGEEWEHLCLPAITDNDEALWEFKHSITDLRLMQQVKPYMFAGQYMQRPAPLDGGMFKTAKIEIVNALPTTAKKICRGWDLGATQDDGDYTAGVKIADGGDGYFYIIDVERGQWSSDLAESNIKLNTQMDGKLVAVRLPQDPAQAGKSQAKAFMRLLAGYNVVVSSVSGDKITRASPFSAQVNAGNVRMIKGEWNKAYTSELSLFPNGNYDDQVDASADAFNHLFDMHVEDDAPIEQPPPTQNFW